MRGWHSGLLLASVPVGIAAVGFNSFAAETLRAWVLDAGKAISTSQETSIGWGILVGLFAFAVVCVSTTPRAATQAERAR